MKSPRTIVFAGYGLNCEEETAFAFETAGARADIVHVNDVIADKKMLRKYQIIAVPGGFSYGDDTGSGRAYANKLRNHLIDELHAFVERDTLTIGICNGFQILTNLELLPGALLHNDSARYIDRYVDLKVTAPSDHPWLRDISEFSAPIAHGEGKYYSSRPGLEELEKNNGIAVKYTAGETSEYLDLPKNPNGSLEDIAGVSAKNGRVLGMMPHPERALFFHQLPHWPLLADRFRREGREVPKTGPGMHLFVNAVEYFA